jgi:hypothetical protein
VNLGRKLLGAWSSTNRIAPSSDSRDQRKPVNTKKRLLLTNPQPRLVDITIKNNSAKDPPTSAIP